MWLSNLWVEKEKFVSQLSIDFSNYSKEYLIGGESYHNLG